MDSKNHSMNRKAASNIIKTQNYLLKQFNAGELNKSV